MNDDQQAPEGVEITNYIGEAASPHPAHLSASGGKAEDVSSPQRGSLAITIWAAIGLACAILGPVLLYNNTPYHFLYALGLDYDRYYTIYIAASWLPIVMEALGLIISIVTLILSRRASHPALVVLSSLLGLLMFLITIWVISLIMNALR